MAAEMLAMMEGQLGRLSEMIRQRDAEVRGDESLPGGGLREAGEHGGGGKMVEGGERGGRVLGCMRGDATETVEL